MKNIQIIGFQVFIVLIFLVSFPVFGQTKPKEEKSPAITNINFKVRNSKKFQKQLDNLPIFENSFSGLCVYDVEKQKFIVQHNDKQYFTPASNAKLFTFYVGLHLLNDKMPALRYTIQGDSLIFWGTGNPTFLHPKLHQKKVFEFIQKTDKKIFFSNANYHDKHFGLGWAWDDYNADYSEEKSAFPIYGNAVRFKSDTLGNLDISPAFFRDSMEVYQTKKDGKRFWAKRNLEKNQFLYHLPKKPKYPRYQEIPLKISPEFVVKLLSDTLRKTVKFIDRPMYKTDSLQTFYTENTDDLFRLMMESSDNFLAEQTILMCAETLNKSKSLNTRRIIGEIIKKYLSDLKQKPRWVDGSGLSRYNLFTPHSMVEILLKIKNEHGKTAKEFDRILHLLPTSGEGTLHSRFKKHEPFIFGKTGTLSNNHNLSGYLKTKSGKLLIFSYMNNHYRTKTKFIKEQTDKILTDFYLYY